MQGEFNAKAQRSEDAKARRQNSQRADKKIHSPNSEPGIPAKTILKPLRLCIFASLR
jgi:hypothetical protein